MFKGNFRMAITSLRAFKGRSLLTMLGIIIGVISVVTTVSLGEGIKHQVVGQIYHLGGNILTIRPGKIVERDSSGRITKVNVRAGYSFAAGSLPASDLPVIRDTTGVKSVIPLSLVTAGVTVNNQQFSNTIIGTSADFPDVVRQKVLYGAFFTDNEKNQPVAVIGQNVANKLFQENSPVGMSLNIHGQDFVVRGVFDQFSGTPIALGPDFNNTIFIPYETAQQISGGNSLLAQVLVQPSSTAATEQTFQLLSRNLLSAHGQQDDFTILRQDENLAVTSDILNVLTAFVAGIAAISLVVGGVGIMNIMLVSVTERTREIGIRKAVGATNKQIMGQFLIEALVLSFVGAFIGFVLAASIVGIIRLVTHLEPVITWPITLFAIAISIGVGVLFGLMPAVKAARMDPIDALRFE